MKFPIESIIARGISEHDFIELTENIGSDHYLSPLHDPVEYFNLLKKIVTLGIFLFFIGSSLAFSAVEVVKVAVLDNLQSEKLATARYIEDYKDGLILGNAIARESKVDYDVRYFLFNDKDMAPEILKIKKWKADVIIGPRSSEFFILLKDQFKDTLVISPFATAVAVSSLPLNMYSLSPDNSETIDMLVDFTQSNFPGRRVFQIVQADCGNCTDSSEQLMKSVKNLKLPLADKVSFLFAAQAELIPMEKLLEGYKKDDIIFLPNTSYVSGVLAGRIADHLKLRELNFLGCTGWGDWAVGNFGKFRSPFYYQGFRVVSWSVKFKDAETLRFQSLFKKIHSAAAEVNVTRINFSLMEGLTEIAVKVKSRGERVNRDSLLAEFLKLRSHVKNPWRPSRYGVFKVNQQGEYLEQN